MTSIMNNAVVDRKFVSFDGGVRCSGRLVELHDRADLARTDIQALHEDLECKLIPRGSSLSFCAASFDERVTSISTINLDKIIELSETDSTVTVESGVTVGNLLEFLVSQGYYLPVIPGYPSITIGGCIAADVHGKNQFKDGNFRGLVRSFVLHNVDHGVIDVREEDLFELTLGGLGLTGTILSATISVFKLPSQTVEVVAEPVDDICNLPDILIKRSASCDFIVSWHDFQQVGSRFGQGFLEWGKFSSSSFDSVSSVDNRTVFPIKESRKAPSPLTLTADTRGFNLPNLFCLATTGLMNSLYEHSQRVSHGQPVESPLSRCLFPNKSLRDLYFHAFGRHGLIEHQIVMAPENLPRYVEKVKWWLRSNDLPITIASAKMFSGEQKFLRFGGAGLCFAIDFPRCAQGLRFLNFLDELTVEIGARPNLFKDSRLPRKIIEATYPEFGEFKKRLNEFDPNRRYQSELSRRLGL
ncbi:MAG: FAD-dependent oxidoreductase [Candidatus Obscuribacterales bacterium]|nr:FAD-dependent oxidoreductase [Candidatus Obscuribacterales bacterium]